MPREQQPLSEQEQRVLALIHEAGEQVRAPASLRQRIDSQRPSTATRVRRRTALSSALAVGLAAAALLTVLLLPDNAPGGPSVSQAAALAGLGPNVAAPVADPTEPLRLETNVGDLYFPNWAKIHWDASGQRADRISGRSATTVYYEWDGRRVAYTIVAAPVLKEPTASTTTLNGTTLRTFTMNGSPVVTWRVANHTCVLSGSGLSARELQELAAWRAPGAPPAVG